MNDSISRIINDGIDIYGILGVSKTSSIQEIRRSYRKKALQYHPDKYHGNDTDGEDESIFDKILISYEILNDTLLRSKYDELCELKESQRFENREKLDELTRKFQDELLDSEKKRKKNDLEKRRKYNIESIREDGLKRRRLQEEKLLNSTGEKKIISIYDIPLKNHILIAPSNNKDNNNNTVLLKYKYKQELKGLIDENIITKMMEIFGKVDNVKLDGHDKRYGYAYVDFQSQEGCDKALDHNYNESAKKWDGTDVRKLASLLRGCKKTDPITDDISELTNNEKVNQILLNFLQNVNSVSDKNAT